MIYLLFVLASSLTVDEPTLKLVQFTDLHYGEGELQDILNAELQSMILDWESPNLVVVTGDLVSGYAWKGQKNWYKGLHSKYIEPMIKAKTPWAITLGNHDIEGDLTGKEIIDLEEVEPLSVTGYQENLNHASNYYIPIYYQGELKFIIYMLDSGNRNHLEYGYDRIHEDQINWVNSVHRNLQVPGMAFMHIPPPEFMDFEWIGHKYEGVACPGNHTRYFLRDTKGLLALSVGHDHFNDYEGEINGVKLFYGRKTGYAGAGPRPYFMHGARIFSIDLNELTIKTHIREEDGGIFVPHVAEGLTDKQVVCVGSQRNWFYYYVAAAVILAFLALTIRFKFIKTKSL